MDRRRFLKAGAAAGATGVGVALWWRAADRLLGPPPAPPPTGPTPYFAARAVAGPAPRGTPLLPLRLAEDGALAVRREGAGVDWLPWHGFCGREDARGLEDAYEGDDVLRYFTSEERAQATRPWYADRVGSPVRPEDFPGDETGATVAWRTPPAAEGEDVLLAVVVRHPKGAVRHVRGVASPARALTDEEFALVRERFVVETEDAEYVACSAVCTHFCCIAGYKEAPRLAEARGAGDKVYCTCHSAVFEPREPVVDVSQVGSRTL